MLISSPVFATKQDAPDDAPDKVVMNIFELGVRPDRDKDFADVAKQTISASVDHEVGTLAMYALHRSDNPHKAFIIRKPPGGPAMAFWHKLLQHACGALDRRWVL